MPESEFAIGQCYFLFGYFDEERRLPEVETYVFIGENLHGEVRGSESQSWYFRNAGVLESGSEGEIYGLSQPLRAGVRWPRHTNEAVAKASGLICRNSSDH